MRTVEAEMKRLQEAAAFYDSRRGLASRLCQNGAGIICRHADGGTMLELGCANGVMTEVFAARFGAGLCVVEGMPAHAETAREIVGENGEVYCALFEEFEPARRFDNIAMAGILEHVADPVGLLRRARGWLAEGGSLHVIVPHALSLHRRVGVALGLSASPYELNEGDLAMGHRRVYDWSLLARDIAEGGLRVVAKEGSFLKPLSNRQMEGWPDELLDAFQSLGTDNLDLCAEIYAKCQVKEGRL
mgnify:CR=1 FL=1